jgi:hypothetical protein
MKLCFPVLAPPQKPLGSVGGLRLGTGASILLGALLGCSGLLGSETLACV